VVAGSPWAYFLPVLVAAIYAQRINQKEASMAEKYSNFAQYRAQTKRLIPFIW
jgi:protein-S-isoprenylcysteine O-methyltransferase Ste14